MRSLIRERDEPQRELFKAELTRFLDMEHAMVKLGDRIDREAFHAALDAM